jgi:hypothetical protein
VDRNGDAEGIAEQLFVGVRRLVLGMTGKLRLLVAAFRSCGGTCRPLVILDDVVATESGHQIR